MKRVMICFLLLAGMLSNPLSPVFAQKEPAEKTIGVRGSVNLNDDWNLREVVLLKDGAAVQQAYEELKKDWSSLRNARAQLNRIGKAPPKKIRVPSGSGSRRVTNDQYKVWEDRRNKANQAIKEATPPFKSSLARFQSTLKANTERKIPLDDRRRFSESLPPGKMVYFSATKRSRNGLWILPASGSVDFNESNKLLDCLDTPD